MIKNLSPIYDLIRADGSIVVNKNLMFSIGHDEAEIYAELISKYNYFNIRETLTEDGYFFNTVDDLYLDTCYGEKTQRKVIERLVGLGLIHYKVKGMPPKRYFRIVDNSELILKYITEGREKREELEKKLLSNVDKSKLRLLGGIKNSITEELKTPVGSVNNTKPNNTKKNNTKGDYINLSIDDNETVDNFLDAYKDSFYGHFKNDHMQTTKEKLREVESWIVELQDSGVDWEFWVDEVNAHFEEIPKSNNGNILAFMQTSFRHFEVQSPSMGGY